MVKHEINWSVNAKDEYIELDRVPCGSEACALCAFLTIMLLMHILRRTEIEMMIKLNWYMPGVRVCVCVWVIDGIIISSIFRINR